MDNLFSFFLCLSWQKALMYWWCFNSLITMFQAIGQVLYLRPYVNDFSTQWVLSSVALLTLGSVLTTYIGERISDLKLGNGTSLLIFTNILSYLPASFGRTIAEAFQNGNYIGLATIILSFVLLVLGIVYVQVSWLRIGQKISSFEAENVHEKSLIFLLRKQREKSQSTMHHDTWVEVEGLKELLTYLSRYPYPLYLKLRLLLFISPNNDLNWIQSHTPYLWTKGLLHDCSHSMIYSIPFYLLGKIV